jgi:hypothetical protein
MSKIAKTDVCPYLVKVVESATGHFNVKNKAVHIRFFQINIKKCVYLGLGGTAIEIELN